MLMMIRFGQGIYNTFAKRYTPCRFCVKQGRHRLLFRYSSNPHTNTAFHFFLLAFSQYSSFNNFIQAIYIQEKIQDIYRDTGDTPGSTHRKLDKVYESGYPYSKKKSTTKQITENQTNTEQNTAMKKRRTWYILNIESVIDCCLLKSVLSFF